MTGKKTVSGKQSGTGPDDTKTPEAGKTRHTDQTRETVEAIAIAFVMAFLFKTFQAELYVIPTGSMAPTLYGRHKEIICEACKYGYAVGASQEIDQDSGIVRDRLNTSECPNCRHINQILDAPVFNGDRILVNKQNGKFERFDVVVFKNPEEPHVNYIKRLVGLPAETIRIRQGDVYARKGDNDPWRIQRKADLSKQKDIQLVVYDDRHPPKPLLAAGFPERWSGAVLQTPAADTGSVTVEPAAKPQWLPSETGWKSDSTARSYSIDVADGKEHWLRYRNLLPGQGLWRDVEETGKISKLPDPSLIVDFCGFNAFSMVNHSVMRNGYDDSGIFWVPDLTLNATVTINSAQEKSRLMFELVEGARWYRCEWSPADGKVNLYLVDRTIEPHRIDPQLLVSVQSSAVGTGTWEWAFANVDDRLCAWIDGVPLEFGAAAEFDLSEPSMPTDIDLAPAGISGTDISATVSELVLQRDIYYRNDTIAYLKKQQESEDGDMSAAYQRMLCEIPEHNAYELLNCLHTPEVYGRRYLELSHQQSESFGTLFEYKLGADEYLMFGDNSPASKDSRLFDYFSRPYRGEYSNRFAVKESDLIGEALFIFWPHAEPFLNDGKGYAIFNHREVDEGRSGNRNGSGSPQIVRGDYPMYRFPFYPQFSRMKKIR